MVLPRVQYNKHIKPYWNNCLKEVKRSVMAARAKWKKEGSQGPQKTFIIDNIRKPRLHIGWHNVELFGNTKEKNSMT